MPLNAPPSFALSPAELDYLHTSLSSYPPIRHDLRGPSDFRPLSAETGVLPAANGSAHVSFADGGEAIVGVRAEVGKTGGTTPAPPVEGGDEMDVDGQEKKTRLHGGRAEWITLTLTLPSARDDDAGVVFLEETLREGLIARTGATKNTPGSSIQDKLPINSRWHFNLYIDVVLISPSAGTGSTPLPLLSVAVYLALRDTRLPMLRSLGEEDPVFEDDWERSTWLFERSSVGKGTGMGMGMGPPITLLVAVAGENVLFDPSREELLVADAVVGVSVASSSSSSPSSTAKTSDFRILALRTLDLAARDTMPGIPRDENLDLNQGGEVEGVWRPKVGGIKRKVFGKIIGAIAGEDGVAAEVVKGLEGFLGAERERERAGV